MVKKDINSLYSISSSCKTSHCQTMLSHWNGVAVGFVTALLIVVIWLYHSNPLYETKAKLLLEDDVLMPKLEFYNGSALIPSASDKDYINSELEILKSHSLMHDVVLKLALNISAYTTGEHFDRSEVYINSLGINISQEITDEAQYALLTETPHTLIIRDDGVAIKNRNIGATYTASPEGRIALPGIILHVSPRNKKSSYPNNEFSITFLPLHKTTDAYLQAVKAYQSDESTSVINIETLDRIPQRGEDLLNAAVDRYIENYIERRSNAFDRTIDFIDTQLASIDTSLLQNKIGTSAETETDVRRQEASQQFRFFLMHKKAEITLYRAYYDHHIRIIDHARTLPTPVKPQKAKVCLIAIATGTAVSILHSLLFGAMHNRVRRKDDITEITDVPIMAQINNYTGRNGNPFVIARDGCNAVSEQFHVLRSNLHFSAPIRNPRTVLITSMTSGEGKTYVAANLAAEVSTSGKRTVIVDINLREPQISDYICYSEATGVSDCLAGNTTIDKSLFAIPKYPNLFILPAGTIPPNATSLLSSRATANLFADLRKQFDYIIIDCAPMTEPDALILGRYADNTLFVARAGQTHTKSIAFVEKLSRENRLPNLGIVLNDVEAIGAERVEEGQLSYG